MDNKGQIGYGANQAKPNVCANNDKGQVGAELGQAQPSWGYWPYLVPTLLLLDLGWI